MWCIVIYLLILLNWNVCCVILISVFWILIFFICCGCFVNNNNGIILLFEYKFNIIFFVLGFVKCFNNKVFVENEKILLFWIILKFFLISWSNCLFFFNIFNFYEDNFFLLSNWKFFLYYMFNYIWCIFDF